MPEERPKRGAPHREVLTEDRRKVKKPEMYRVVLINDDYTPMEFVVWVLQVVFSKSEQESARLMLDVHNSGRGVCGVFTLDVARTKSYQVLNLAKKHEHPLECLLEVVGSE